jgi:hypothetical protein
MKGNLKLINFSIKFLNIIKVKWFKSLCVRINLTLLSKFQGVLYLPGHLRRGPDYICDEKGESR